MSRFHMGMGAMSYLLSPLWLLFLLVGLLSAGLKSGTLTPWTQRAAETRPEWWISGSLFIVTMTLLLLPKLWGYLLLLREPRRLAACGGSVKALASVLLETFVSVLVAPIMMAFQVTFVVSTFLGFRVTWNAQQRREQGQSFRAAFSAHWKQMVAGLLAAGVTWLVAPGLLVWLAPVLCGLILAIPLSMILSSVGLGQALARWGC